MSLKHLASKLLAGGLTAGIVLIWWPTHYSTTGLEALVARGIVATLGFELMLLAFAGVEDRVVARLSGRSARFARLRERAVRAPRPARTGLVLAAGGVALIVPVLALASAGSPRVPEARAATPAPVVQPVRERIVRQVVVKRRVIHDEVVVAAPSSPSPTPSAPAVPSTSAAKATPKPALGRRVATTQPKAAAKATTPAESTPTPVAATTTTPAPAPVDTDAVPAATEPSATP